jgi:hypothetical protein
LELTPPWAEHEYPQRPQWLLLDARLVSHPSSGTSLLLSLQLP